MPGKGDGYENKADERESTEDVVDGHGMKKTVLFDLYTDYGR